MISIGDTLDSLLLTSRDSVFRSGAVLDIQLGVVAPAPASIEPLVDPGQIPEHTVEALRVAPQLEQRPALVHRQSEDLGAQIPALRARDFKAMQAFFQWALHHAFRTRER